MFKKLFGKKNASYIPAITEIRKEHPQYLVELEELAQEHLENFDANIQPGNPVIGIMLIYFSREKDSCGWITHVTKEGDRYIGILATEVAGQNIGEKVTVEKTQCLDWGVVHAEGIEGAGILKVEVEYGDQVKAVREFWSKLGEELQEVNTVYNVEENITLTHQTHADMQKAQHTAQETMDNFFLFSSTADPERYHSAVKVNVEGEHIWLNNCRYDEENKTITGKISVDPQTIEYEYGDFITVPRETLSDWQIVDEKDKVIYGGFTTRVLLSEEEKTAFEEKVGKFVEEPLLPLMKE